MPISSEIKARVPRTAPEGLIGWAINKKLLERATLVYKIVWDWDNGLEAMFEQRFIKKKYVEVTCSECGQSTLLNYAPDVNNSKWGKQTYGFWTHYEYCCGGETIGDGDEVECPSCGARCVAKKAASIGKGRYVSAEAAVMSACLTETTDAGEKRPLALTAWRIRRASDRYGYDRYTAEPLDAYVFDGAEAAKLTGSMTQYSGTAGYFTAIKHCWDMPKRWTCDWDSCTEIFGLTPEMIAESSVENSKLDEYMQPDPVRGGDKYPIPYMRLWQAHPQVENIVHQGGARILDALFEKYTSRPAWRENREGKLDLPELNWKETRPAQILRLDKEEWRWMREMNWSAYHWHVFITAKQVGDRMALPDDIILLHQYGAEDIEEIIGRAPVGKCLRYLMKQYEKMGVAMDEAMEDYENDETDPLGAIWDERLMGARELADYWRMAEACGWDLNDPEVKWPKLLIDAHDRATEAYSLLKKKNQAKLFDKVYKMLSCLTYASGDILIRPAKTLKELIKEGGALHHCVGTYGEAHISGKPIFFVRHYADPETPWYTLQFDFAQQKVIQNRGKYNCARTKEVEAFELEWIEWVKTGAPRNEDGTPVGAKPTPDAKRKPRKKKENAA